MDEVVEELLALAAKVNGNVVARAAALGRIQVLLHSPVAGAAVLRLLETTAQRDAELAKARRELRDKVAENITLTRRVKALEPLQGVVAQFEASERAVAQLHEQVRQLRAMHSK